MKTDWDSYYKKPYKSATYSRSIVQKILINLISTYGCRNLELAEFGGANSCFFAKIQEKIQPLKYYIVDNNKLGLDKFAERTSTKSTILYNKDVLKIDIKNQFDLTFSVGLIEHFNTAETATAITNHFEATKPGGIVIISFPTPTWLYKITRCISEKLGMWIFHDERPLLPNEVLNTIAKHGEVLFKKTIWPIFLTQHIIVAQKVEQV